MKSIGAIEVRRALPNPKSKMIGPWIFIDHMGPVAFAPGTGIDVRPHPHINLATVTYLFEGEILHRDALGSVQPIEPGAINLMVTGSGLVHSERERPEVKQTAHKLHGLQLWLALPDKAEETEPAFYHYPAASIPHALVNDVRVRVLMGSAFGVKSPVKLFSDTLYCEAKLHANQQLALPGADELAVYIVSGRALINNETVDEHSLAIANPAEALEVKALTALQIAVVGGASVGPRFIEWNFVSSRRERIERAKADWREGRFALIPNDDKEFIPLPD